MANVYTKTIFGELDDFTDITDAYIDGAKWADKTMIDKASRWLESNTNPVFYSGNGWTTEEFIDNFKKAMEL